MADRQPNNDAESGGLNIVFESGSSGRENKRYVRSHAAKVGWSQRSRNKPTFKEDAEGCPSRKRRKTQSHPAPDPPSSHQATSSISRQSIPPTIQHDASIYTRPSSIGHCPLLGKPQSNAYPLPGPSAVTSPLSSISPSDPPHQHHSGHARIQESVESSTFDSVARVERPPQSMPHAIAPWRVAPNLYHHVSPSRQGFVSSPRSAEVAAPALSQGHDSPLSARSLPSPRPSPPSDNHTLSSRHLSLANANWRQYDDSQHINTRTPQPGGHADSARSSSEATSSTTADQASMSPTSARLPSSSFLELVLNEDYPLWKPVDSGNDSFGVFPVTWQPIYSRLFENYRSNMLVQLEEILTGWSMEDKIEFNQMPLRLATNEPALFYSLLATASIMMPPGLINPSIPKWLQGRTVKCLNEALSDPKRAYSDATILTVNLVALFESTLGNAQVTASLHQPVLRKMVDSRGGLKCLSANGTLDALNLVRFLAWTDRVIRCQTGNTLIFSDFKEDPSVSNTNWGDIWARMERRVVDNVPTPVQELPDEK